MPWHVAASCFAIGWLTSELPFHIAFFFTAFHYFFVTFHQGFAYGFGLCFVVVVAWHLWGVRQARRAISALREKHKIHRYPRPTSLRDVSRFVSVMPLFGSATGVRRETKVWFMNMKMDIYSSAKNKGHRARRPVVLYVHGGTWVAGKRTQCPALLEALAQDGTPVFALDYCLVPHVTLSVIVADIKKGIDWVKSECAAYGGDPTQLIIMGGSAGGHLAALAALTGHDKSLQTGFENADCSVFACIPFYGVYNLDQGRER